MYHGCRPPSSLSPSVLRLFGLKRTIFFVMGNRMLLIDAVKPYLDHPFLQTTLATPLTYLYSLVLCVIEDAGLPWAYSLIFTPVHDDTFQQASLSNKRNLEYRRYHYHRGLNSSDYYIYV